MPRDLKPSVVMDVELLATELARYNVAVTLTDNGNLSFKHDDDNVEIPAEFVSYSAQMRARLRAYMTAHHDGIVDDSIEGLLQCHRLFDTITGRLIQAENEVERLKKENASLKEAMK